MTYKINALCSGWRMRIVFISTEKGRERSRPEGHGSVTTDWRIAMTRHPALAPHRLTPCGEAVLRCDGGLGSVDELGYLDEREIGHLGRRCG
ncbi:hypothetical protein Drose_17560 [Dactylosporangium roseum]|uniref:Uncharacterized protein n=1 Tax=Dactylosporangium roseum TaxID=47989 RepID=A0ABY5ZCM5_9ACTN|nr:hypothetical protein [Dactylosporangium roseum]UWZ39860.1 hypothetical protein Drose_17560 [Dactylosporangium roseum]